MSKFYKGDKVTIHSSSWEFLRMRMDDLGLQGWKNIGKYLWSEYSEYSEYSEKTVWVEFTGYNSKGVPKTIELGVYDYNVELYSEPYIIEPVDDELWKI